LLECPIRAPHPQMGRSDLTLLTTGVSPLAPSDMYVATGQVQEYSVGSFCPRDFPTCTVRNGLAFFLSMNLVVLCNVISPYVKIFLKVHII
jgi:hypothetical protein